MMRDGISTVRVEKELGFHTACIAEGRDFRYRSIDIGEKARPRDQTCFIKPQLLMFNGRLR